MLNKPKDQTQGSLFFSLESTLNHGEHYYCGACCYLESKCNKGKYKCLETGEYKKYHCKACEKFRDLPF